MEQSELTREQVAEALIVHDLREANSNLGNALCYAMDLSDADLVERVGAAISAVGAARKQLGDRHRDPLA